MARTRRNWGYVFRKPETHKWVGVVMVPGRYHMVRMNHWFDVYEYVDKEVRKADERSSTGD